MKNTPETPTTHLTSEESSLLAQFLELSADGRTKGAAIEDALLTSIAFALRRTLRGC